MKKQEILHTQKRLIKKLYKSNSFPINMINKGKLWRLMQMYHLVLKSTWISLTYKNRHCFMKNVRIWVHHDRNIKFFKLI